MKTASVLMLFGRIVKPKEHASSNARKSLAGAIACVALSLIPLVVVLTVSDGMIEGITGRLVGLSSYHMQVAQNVTINGTNENFRILNDIADKMRNIQGVTAAFIERSGSVLAAGKKGRSGAELRAVDETFFTVNNAFSKYVDVVEGTASFPTEDSAVVGKKIAETIGLNVGDTIRIISGKNSAGGNVIPKVKAFKVSGIVSSGYQEIDALWVFVPLETGFSFLSSAASQIFVGIETEDAFSDQLGRIAIEAYSFLPSQFDIYTWKELNSSQYETYASTRILLVFIMVLIVLVASVNISSALVMLVLERRKETAVLKSLGASPSGIAAAYLLTGAAAGGVGTLFGIPLGLVCALKVNEIIKFCENVVNVIGRFVYIISAGTEYIPVHLLDPAYYLEEIPVNVPFPELFFIAVLAVSLSAVVSIVPAVHAGREKPLSILRKV